MANEWLAPAGFAVLFLLILAQVPIGIAMLIVGAAGYALAIGIECKGEHFALIVDEVDMSCNEHC